MRKEPFSVGSYVHLMKRGTRGMPFIRDESDRWRFLKLLRYLNDENVPRNWEREVELADIRDGFARPKNWGPAKPYVSILSYCLMDNHFHLLVREIRDDGISTFMHRLSTSMSQYFNAKYREKGTLFQGPYHARVVTTDEHLEHLVAYITVKNPLQLFPGGLKVALTRYDDAIIHAREYPFSSLLDHLGERHSRILDHETLEDVYALPQHTFFSNAFDLLRTMHLDDEFIRLTMDD